MVNWLDKISTNDSVCNLYWYGNLVFFHILDVLASIVVQSAEICAFVHFRKLIFCFKVSGVKFSLEPVHTVDVFSFLFLWGPLVYLKHMFSRERLALTVVYGGTLFATLYSALHMQSTPFTVLFAVGQIVTLLWTVVSSIPGGTTGLSFFSKMFTRGGGSALPI